MNKWIAPMKFQARCPLDSLSLNMVLEEVNSGLRCLRAIQEIFELGNSINRETTLDTKSYYIEGVFSRLFDYVVNAFWHPIEHETEFMDAIGFVHALSVTSELYSFEPLPQCETLIVFAVARAKLDIAHGYPTYDPDSYSYFLSDDGYNLSISEVALLAHMDEKSVRNATQSGKQDRLITQKNDNGVYVKATDALDWLTRRQGFRPTKPQAPTISIVDGVEYVLVPKAFDDTVFSASCKLGKGYKIGKKGEEIYIDSVWDALAALKLMNKAYWRRPNENGISGIVSVYEWVPIEKDLFLAP